MLDPVRIKARAFHFGSCSAIILASNSVVQEKFGPTLRRVDFDRQHHRRSDQDPILALFGDDERPLFDAQATSQFCRQHHRAAAADLTG